MVHLRGGTQGVQWRSFFWLWVKQTSTRAPDLSSSFLAGISNQRIELGGALGDAVCVSLALSDCRCMGTVVIGGPVDDPEKEREDSLELVPGIHGE